MTNWVSAVQQLRRERRPGVLVTITEVRGHAPRDAGTKMVVGAGEEARSASTSTRDVGDGRRRQPRGDDSGQGAADADDPAPGEPESMTMSLNDKVRTEHGRQCCGGEVILLFERLGVVPSVAIFGMGHVGLELARILCRHDLDLHVVDSRADRVAEDRLACLDDGPAVVPAHHSPVPEVALGEVPTGHARPDPDPRSCGGLRALRRGPALLAPRLDRPDRLVCEVAPVPAGSAGRGSLRRRPRAHPVRRSAHLTSPARIRP